jgi:hypothetical protein
MISKSRPFNTYLLVFSLVTIILGIALVIHPELSLNRAGGITPPFELRLIGVLFIVAGAVGGATSIRGLLKRDPG